MSRVNQAERAFRAWAILTGIAARKEQPITYGGLGGMLGVHPRVIRYVLSLIQDYCLEERLPPLTILVVNRKGVPGSGFVAHDVARLDEGMEDVRNMPWNTLENPFAFAASGKSYEAILSALRQDPGMSEDVYRRVKSRGIKQIIFRDLLLRAYSGSCAFTGMEITEGLEAAHIIPWNSASDAQRLDVRNGLLLNSFHHKLFDAGYFTLTTDHRIVYSDPNDENSAHAACEKPWTIDLHGKKMRLPLRINQRPLAEYITRHHAIAGWSAEAVAIP